MKQPVRFFAIGLITASITLFFVMFLIDKPEVATDNEMDIDEMIESISDQGYHVLSSSEYISLSAKNDSEGNMDEKEEIDEATENKDQDNEEQKTNNEANEEEPKEEDEVFKYTLKIKPNMLGPEISEILNDNKIIDDSDEFNRYLEKEGYAPYIQLGDFKLNSDMSHFEIAEAIARKR